MPCNTPFHTNPCAVWFPTVSQHWGTAGKCLLRRGGEGRQAPTGGYPTHRRGLGAEPRLPGLHGEPPAGAVPAQSPVLRQPVSCPAPTWPSKAGGSGPWHLLAVSSCSRLPAPRGYLRALRGQEQAGCQQRPRTQGVGPRWLWGAGGGSCLPHYSDP